VKFPYSSIISADPDTGDFLLFRRPEIPVTIVGSAGSATYVGLVDTGSDNTIFPKSVADLLGIPVLAATGPAASVFGGQRIQLLTADVTLKLDADGESIVWRTQVCFFDFPSADEETVILGHAGFLDYLTATFDGQAGILTLIPNSDLPSTG
jgi:predicted aspartyl protease